jgi:hypothetical protein
MSSLINSFVALANGAYGLAHHLVSAITLAVIVAALALGWLARIECDEMDRRGTKPTVGTH